MYDKYKAKHHSMSVNKWRKEMEERFELDADGDTPTEKMEDALDQIEDLIYNLKFPVFLTTCS